MSIVQGGWSNEEAQLRCQTRWAGEPHVLRKYEDGEPCGAARYLRQVRRRRGLCCHPHSRYRLETVFEHFSCPVRIMRAGEQRTGFAETPDPAEGH